MVEVLFQTHPLFEGDWNKYEKHMVSRPLGHIIPVILMYRLSSKYILYRHCITITPDQGINGQGSVNNITFVSATVCAYATCDLQYSDLSQCQPHSNTCKPFSLIIYFHL